MNQEISAGFVILEANYDNGFHYLLWDNSIAFLDSEDVTIYQTGINDQTNDFIVKRGDAIYVNEERLSELIEIAAIAPEQRQKTYSIDAVVEVRSAENTVYFFRIINLDAEKVDDITTYSIKYEIASNKGANDGKKLITWVETKDGVTYDRLEFIDDNLLHIQTGKNRELGSIFLTSPSFPGLTYKIAVDK